MKRDEYIEFLKWNRHEDGRDSLNVEQVVDHYILTHPDMGNTAERDEPLQIAITALNEISEGKGRYDMDRLRHAANTIEDMVELAKIALSKIIP